MSIHPIKLLLLAVALAAASPALACAPPVMLGASNSKVQAVEEKAIQKKPLSEEEKKYLESYRKDFALVNALREKSPTGCGQPTPQDDYNKQIDALYKKWESN